MAYATLEIVVSDVADVLPYFDQIKVYRSDEIDGTFTEITAIGTRIVLQASQLLYEFVDADGEDPALWYKTAYYNSGTGAESPQSDARQAAVKPRAFAHDPALSVISIEELEEIYLFGVDLRDSAGNPLPQRAKIHTIKKSVAYIGNYLDLALSPEVVEGEKLDFIYNDYYKWNDMKLLRRPVQSVTQVSMVLPPSTAVTTWTDQSYFKIDKLQGRLRIAPNSSQVILGTFSMWGPILSLGQTIIPHVFSVNYTAGFEYGEVPADIKDAVGKHASIALFNIAGDIAFGPGLSEERVRLDGAETSFRTTQSATAAAYGARIANYKKELAEELPRLRDFYTGIRTAII